jgi:hypothetical protein
MEAKSKTETLKPWMLQAVDNLISVTRWLIALAVENHWTDYGLMELPEKGKWEHELGGGQWGPTRLDVWERNHRVDVQYEKREDGGWHFWGSAEIVDVVGRTDQEGVPEGVFMNGTDAVMVLDYETVTREHGFIQAIWAGEELREWFFGPE